MIVGLNGYGRRELYADPGATKERSRSKNWVKTVFASVSAAAGVAAILLGSAADAYRGMATPKLHVTGRYLQDPNGKNVLLHGYMQAGASWFNGEGHNYTDPSDYSSASSCAGMLNFYNGAADIMSQTSAQYGSNHGWYAGFTRLCGNGTPNGFAPGWDSNGNLTNTAQFNGYINNILVPYAQHCKQVGLYLVITGTPSEVFPGGNTGRNMTLQYQNNLVTFWQTLASSNLRGMDNVLFEICNEPITIESSFGAGDWGSGQDKYWAALTNFMQPVVNAIRNQNADNIILIPGLGYQGEYQGFPNHQLTGGNIAYAAHLYPAYGGVYDNQTAVNNLWNSNYKPAADQLPMFITECWWNPNNGQGYQNLWNASTAGFGNAVKSCFDNEGNVSYLVGMVGDLLANLNSGLGSTTLSSGQGAQASFGWWNQYTWAAPGAPTGGPSSGIYEVSPSNATGLAMDVYGASSANGARIDQWTWNSGSNQKWYFHALGNNLYWLEPQNAIGKCLDVMNINPNNGAVLQTYTYWGGLGQIWYAINLGNGNYRLNPEINPSECLDQTGGSTAAGTYLETYAYWGAAGQQWKLTAR